MRRYVRFEFLAAFILVSSCVLIELSSFGLILFLEEQSRYEESRRCWDDYNAVWEVSLGGNAFCRLSYDKWYYMETGGLGWDWFANSRCHLFRRMKPSPAPRPLCCVDFGYPEKTTCF